MTNKYIDEKILLSGVIQTIQKLYYDLSNDEVIYKCNSMIELTQYLKEHESGFSWCDMKNEELMKADKEYMSLLAVKVKDKEMYALIKIYGSQKKREVYFESHTLEPELFDELRKV